MSQIYYTARLLRRESAALQIKIIKFAGYGVQVILFCLMFLNGHGTLQEAGVKIELWHEMALVVVSLLFNVLFQIQAINPRLDQVRRLHDLG